MFLNLSFKIIDTIIYHIKYFTVKNLILNNIHLSTWDCFSTIKFNKSDSSSWKESLRIFTKKKNASTTNSFFIFIFKIRNKTKKDFIKLGLTKYKHLVKLNCIKCTVPIPPWLVTEVIQALNGVSLTKSL